MSDEVLEGVFVLYHLDVKEAWNFAICIKEKLQ